MHDLRRALRLAIVVLIFCSSLFGQSDPVITQTDTAPVVAPGAPSNVQTKDTPDDAGNSIDITWQLSADDQVYVTKYQVLRGLTPTGPFTVVGTTTKGQNAYTDNNLKEGTDYFYRIAALNETNADTTVGPPQSFSAIVGPVKAVGQWFNMRRVWIIIWTLVIFAAILFYISRAKSGAKLYVRKIAGIEAVDEAIGRATEMGRKVFYIPGIQDMDDPQTIAAVIILGRVARIAAESDTQLEVPVSKSLVMVSAREAVREAYSKAGRPDSFKEDQVHYVTDDQFGYAAAIDGMVVREKPATMFFMGAFFAESLILAETGNSAGAIQIAGTGQPSQLPFFVASCDYTLIGEELFAASAYLGREPKLLGSLKGQDFAKAAFLIVMLVGIIAEILGWTSFLKILEVS